VAGKLSVLERRVGKDGRSDWCEAVGEREFFSEVFEVAVIKIDLYGRRATHHIPRALPASVKVRTHDFITLLWNPSLLFQLAQRIKPYGDEDYSVRFAYFNKPLLVLP